MRDGLPDVVQERSAFGDAAVDPDLGRERGRDVRRFHQMLQDVLSVRGPVLQSTEKLDHLGVDVGDLHLRDGVLARTADPLLDLSLRTLVDLLDPRRLDPAVLDELLQRHARRLATNRVEAAEDHGLGRVVDDQVDPRRRFERADVSAFPADDPTLHIVARQGEDAHRRLRRLLGGDTLDRDRDDLASALLPLLASSLLDLPDLRHRGSFRLFDDLPEQMVARLGGGHAGDPLQLRPVKIGGLLELLPYVGQFLLALVELLTAGLHSRRLRAQILLGVGHPLLEPRQLLAPRPDVLLHLASHRDDLVLRLLEGPLRGDVGLALGLQKKLLGPRLHALGVRHGHRLADHEPDAYADSQRDGADQHGLHPSSQHASVCVGEEPAMGLSEALARERHGSRARA